MQMILPLLQLSLLTWACRGAPGADSAAPDADGGPPLPALTDASAARRAAHSDDIRGLMNR